jgi:hypothetical protein
MSKPSKNKKEKVPKITEEEYLAYVSSLRELTATEEKKQTKASQSE